MSNTLTIIGKYSTWTLLHKYTLVHGSKILTLIDKELTVVI